MSELRDAERSCAFMRDDLSSSLREGVSDLPALGLHLLIAIFLECRVEDPLEIFLSAHRYLLNTIRCQVA